MRLNIYSIDYHIRPVVGTDKKTDEPIYGVPQTNQNDRVAAESQEAAIAGLKDEVETDTRHFQVEHVGNGPQDVLVVLPQRKPAKPARIPADNKQADGSKPTVQ